MSTLFKAISELKQHQFVNDELYHPIDVQMTIATPSGDQSVIGFIKKRSDTMIVELMDDRKIECAVTHRFISPRGEIHASDLVSRDMIKTSNGYVAVRSIYESKRDAEVFDIEIAHPSHVYYTADGVLHHNTSMCAALSMMLYSHGLQTLVIVPSKDLVTQTVDEFRDRLQNFDVTIGEYSGESKHIDHPIVVGTWQSLQNAAHYMSYFQAVIVDEAHGVKANVVRDLINEHGKHISHRYGCTGTFPKGAVDKYALTTSIGRIVREVRAKWLIEQGYLSEIQILPVETLDDDPKLPDYASERAFITNMSERTEAIARYIEELRREYGNTLVLVNTSALAQGRELNKLIDGSVYLDGTSASAVREANYQQFDCRDDMIVIASAGIASTGISIDRIFCLVLLDTGKSFVKCIQSVGRGLRKKGDKNKIFVVDVYAKMKYAKKHYKERKSYYVEAEYPVLDVHKLRY